MPWGCMQKELEFTAAIAKVQTLVDNGIRVTLDLGEDEVAAAAMLMAFKREGVAIKVSIKAIAG